jgi:hypothetical protein
MNPQVMQAAYTAYERLNSDERREAKALPGRLRTMGLVATLEWLDGKELQGLLSVLLRQLNLDSRAELEQQLSSVVFLHFMRRSATFAEALHLVARADRQKESSP